MTLRYQIRTVSDTPRVVYAGTDADDVRRVYEEQIARAPHDPIELVAVERLAETPAATKARADMRRAYPWLPDTGRVDLGLIAALLLTYVGVGFALVLAAWLRTALFG